MKGPLRISLLVAAAVALPAFLPRIAHALPAHSAGLPLAHSVSRTANPASAPRPGHAPRPARAPHRAPAGRTGRHGGPSMVSDLPPAAKHPHVDDRRRVQPARAASGESFAHAIPDGRGPPRASPFAAFALCLPFLRTLPRRTLRLRAARRPPAHPAHRTLSPPILRRARGWLSILTETRAPP
jgi:hypothetical protein